MSTTQDRLKSYLETAVKRSDVKQSDWFKRLSKEAQKKYLDMYPTKKAVLHGNLNAKHENLDIEHHDKLKKLVGIDNYSHSDLDKMKGCIDKVSFHKKMANFHLGEQNKNEKKSV